MSQTQEQSSGAGVLILLVLVVAVLKGGGDSARAPIRVNGLTCLYLEETDVRGAMTPDQQLIFTARGPGSVKAFCEAAAHKTDGHPDVRWFDQDDDVSLCLPVMSEIKKRWEAAGKPVPWRHITDGKRFYEGPPTSTADELAKLQTLKS